METEFVRAGSSVAGRMTCGPEPGMLKEMKLDPGAALAEMIACRNEKGPLSKVLVTVNVAARPADTDAQAKTAQNNRENIFFITPGTFHGTSPHPCLSP